jgi:hypothetical protein
MMEALIGGQRDPRALAALAKGLAREKTERPEEAIAPFCVQAARLAEIPGWTPWPPPN